MNFAAIVEAEPRIADVEHEARRAATSDSYCLPRSWYGRDGIKRRMSGLVGWERRRDEWAATVHADELDVDALMTDEDAARLVAIAEDIVAGRAWLWSSAAYDVASRALLEELEPCRCCCAWHRDRQRRWAGRT